MRVVLGALIGLALGVVLMFAIQTTSTRYAYFTVPREECEMMPPSGAEVVPNQPNPCHFRRSR